jgi:uncharacterized phage protein (TIGR02218 family)
MKTISTALKNHLAQEVTTLCTCWKAVLTNGTIYGFTDNIEDILFEGVLYRASSGFTPSSIASNSSMAVDNLEVMGLLSDDTITEADINAGLWDFADITVIQLNYNDLTQGSIVLHRGNVGEIKFTNQQFTAEFRGISQRLQQTIGELYSAGCRASLGDSRCKIDLPSITVSSSVVTIDSTNKIITCGLTNPTEYFNAGLLTFTSGLNNGLSMEVKLYTNPGIIELHLPLSYQIAVGDTFSVYPGCTKRFTEDCKNKFNNVLNFRGEPHVPGNDQLLKVASHG